MTRLIGLRHDVIAKDDIYYLIFYDIDHDITEDEIERIDYVMLKLKIAYMLIKTKNGYHIIGLSPLTAWQWSEVFLILKGMFHSYYGGIIIRLSRKKEEIQTLTAIKESYGEVIPNLYNLYASRFGLQKKEWKKEFAKYLLVFEKYRTEKE